MQATCASAKSPELPLGARLGTGKPPDSEEKRRLRLRSSSEDSTSPKRTLLPRPAAAPGSLSRRRAPPRGAYARTVHGYRYLSANAGFIFPWDMDCSHVLCALWASECSSRSFISRNVDTQPDYTPMRLQPENGYKRRRGNHQHEQEGPEEHLASIGVGEVAAAHGRREAQAVAAAAAQHQSKSVPGAPVCSCEGKHQTTQSALPHRDCGHSALL